MNWKLIQQEWESGNHEIAVKLVESMIHEMRFKQRTLSDFSGPFKGGVVE